jgi:ParB-like chromosome segregation protein Spo0J
MEAAVIADHSIIREIKIASIKVGQRHRREMGDMAGLAVSIRQEVLLQPIGVTDRLELVFGQRRILAVRGILKKETMLARGLVQRGRETAWTYRP